MDWKVALTATVVFLVFVTVGIAFFQIRNYKYIKKQREHFTTLHSSLKPGVKVSFSNGLFGKVRSINEDLVDIEIKSGALITVSRYAISSIEE